MGAREENARTRRRRRRRGGGFRRGFGFGFRVVRRRPRVDGSPPRGCSARGGRVVDATRGGGEGAEGADGEASTTPSGEAGAAPHSAPFSGPASPPRDAADADDDAFSALDTTVPDADDVEDYA